MNELSRPLVSISMPFYENHRTLPVALASVVAQTWKNWECWVCDDGSSHSAETIVKQFNDERIKYFRLEKNHGRGFARQKILEMGNGKYLTMVDADDWIYPQRIQHQAEILESAPDIALISSSMAVVKGKFHLSGVRIYGSTAEEPAFFKPMKQPKPLALSHAASMIRMSIAKNLKYDTKFRTSEDFDFLLQILLKHKYALCPHILYAYTEYDTLTKSKIFSSLKSRQKVMNKYLTRFPIRVIQETLKIASKKVIYQFAFSLGVADKIIARRSANPSGEDTLNFQKCLNEVNRVLEEKGFARV